MCSTTGGQLARICQAIEELAGRPGPGDSAGPEPGQATAPGDDNAAAGDDNAAAGDDLAARLARLAAIWEMVAEADPELAKRLPGYLAAPE